MIAEQLDRFRANSIQQISLHPNFGDVDVESFRQPLFRDAVCDRFQDHEVLGHTGNAAHVTVVSIGFIFGREEESLPVLDRIARASANRSSLLT